MLLEKIMLHLFRNTNKSEQYQQKKTIESNLLTKQKYIIIEVLAELDHTYNVNFELE